MDDRVGASALARDLYTTLEWMRAMAQQPSYRDGSLEFEIEAVRKAAAFIDGFHFAGMDGWELLRRNGEGYPPPEFIYRGGLYTYRLVE